MQELQMNLPLWDLSRKTIKKHIVSSEVVKDNIYTTGKQETISYFNGGNNLIQCSTELINSEARLWYLKRKSHLKLDALQFLKALKETMLPYTQQGK